MRLLLRAVAPATSAGAKPGLRAQLGEARFFSITHRRSVPECHRCPLPCTFAQVRDPELHALLGEARFFSITYRLFKLAGVETACEDYGQAARYKVGLDGLPALVPEVVLTGRSARTAARRAAAS